MERRVDIFVVSFLYFSFFVAIPYRIFKQDKLQTWEERAFDASKYVFPFSPRSYGSERSVESTHVGSVPTVTSREVYLIASYIFFNFR